MPALCNQRNKKCSETGFDGINSGCGDRSPTRIVYVRGWKCALCLRSLTHLEIASGEDVPDPSPNKSDLDGLRRRPQNSREGRNNLRMYLVHKCIHTYVRRNTGAFRVFVQCHHAEATGEGGRDPSTASPSMSGNVGRAHAPSFPSLYARHTRASAAVCSLLGTQQSRPDYNSNRLTEKGKELPNSPRHQRS